MSESAFFELRPDVKHLGLFPDDAGELHVEHVDPVAMSYIDGRARWDSRFYDRALEAQKGHVKDHAWQLALDTYRAVDARAPEFLDYARVRKMIANRFRHELYPATGDRSYLKRAEQLEQARSHAIYELDTIECTPHVEWFGRAGLAKYCPQDARDAAMRAQARYVPRLLELMAQGHEVRFGVFTWPNVPRWHLAAGVDGIFRAFRDRMLYGRVDGKIAGSLDDGKRRFPSLRGALATLEVPLSRPYLDAAGTWVPGDWNLHLNVLLVFKPAPGDAANWRHIGGRLVPDYGPLREAWGANVEFRDVPADVDAARAAMAELVKYTLKTVSWKSAEKRQAGSEAPPWVEWPVDACDEWDRAHRGLRRTRSWGELYHTKCPEREPLSGASRIPLGTIKLSPSRCVVSVPIPANEVELDSIIGDKFRAPADRGGPDPPDRAKRGAAWRRKWRHG